MAFADQKSLKERSAGMAGAIILPAALGAIFVSGLAVTDIVITQIDEPIDVFDVKDEIPPPPPPEAKPDTPQENPISEITAPELPFEFPETTVTAKPLDELPSLSGDVIPTVLPDIGDGVPSLPSVKPKIASPRNNPGGWVTTRDYRNIWITREWAGSASFELSVGANGRVSDCRITRSTGHNALDKATCQLITKRARFNPAKDASGQNVSGTFASSIKWELPD